MSRLLVSTVAVLAVFAAVPASAQQDSDAGATLVVGQNDPAVDVANVQAAVDQGGDVSLRGLFDFGAGGVVITKDVNIIGRVGKRGTLLTTISGGFQTFSSGPSPTPVLAPGPRISIRHLNFVGARAAAIFLTYASDVEISGNYFSGIVPAPGAFPGINGQKAVYIGGLLPAYKPGVVTGSVRVKHNVMDMKSSLAAPALCQGVALVFTTGVEAEISHNEISDCARNSIEVLENYRGVAGEGSILIAHNWIVTPAKGLAFPTPTTPDGIVFGWFFNPAAAADPTKASLFEVAHNYVETNGAAAVGIVVLTTDSSVHHNSIGMNTGSVGIYTGTGDNLVEGNAVTGTGSFAFLVAQFSPAYPVATQDYLLGNDVSMFTPTVADYMLQASTTGNVICGATGSVIDLGIGNTVNIGTSCGGAD